MTPHSSHDAPAENLRRLAVLSPDTNRTERVRAECRTRFERSRRRERHLAVTTGFAWSVVGPAALCGFCVFYAAALIATALRLRAVFL